MNAETVLARLYETSFGSVPAKVEKLAGAGSNRSYYRITGSNETKKATVIGTIGTDLSENNAFISLSRHLSSKSLPVPEVLAVSDDGMAYLQTDLGEESLFDAITSGRLSGSFSSYEEKLIESAIKLLPAIQFKGAEGMDYSICYPYPELDSRTISGDLNYFKYDFLKPSGLEFSEKFLDDELESLLKQILHFCCKNVGFMVRDFQSRNVMICGNAPCLIDFQGGRRGPSAYDVASFLWQAKANFSERLRERLIKAYVENALAVNAEFDADEFVESLPYFVLFRMLQTLGAYGFRGLVEGKPHFLQSIPPAIGNLISHLSEKSMADSFPYLGTIARGLLTAPRMRQIVSALEIPAFDGLTITVISFSYKKGIPIDMSGNGGGYVFDCRAIHNPGRYEPYKALTGRDMPVKKFLEDDGGIYGFLDHVMALVKESAECYIQRGFASLSVNFGCTGGQHRSVYSAEYVARRLHECYPGIRIVLNHREQGILDIMNPTDRE